MNSRPPKSKRYKTWMRLRKPQPPRTTLRRNRMYSVGASSEDGRAPPNLLFDLGQDEANLEAPNSVIGDDFSRDQIDELASVNDESDENYSITSTIKTSCSCCGTSASSQSEHWSGSEVDSVSEAYSSPKSSSTLDREDDFPHVGGINNAESNIKRPKKLESLEEPISMHSKTTKFEAMMMVLSYAFRHGLTAVAREELCSLINHLLGSECIPSSTYFFRKIFGSIMYSIHFYCSLCGCYVGELKSDENRSETLDCPVQSCQKQCETKTLNDGFFFITLPIRDQLQFLLENTEHIEEYLHHRWSRDVDSNVISDIFDGSIYKELSEPGNILHDRYNISLTCNTDGACVFKSSKNSLWPIHFRLNELPPSVRFNQSNNLIAGLWFGSQDPDMSMYLSPFVKEVQDLYSSGLTWKMPEGEVVHSKVILLQCVLDSVAKPKVQGSRLFNGFYGCAYCLHPGIVLEHVTSNHAKYLMNSDFCLLDDLSVSYTVNKYVSGEASEKAVAVEDRTDDGIRRDMAQAENLKANSRRINTGDIHVRGIKGYSTLFPLLYFNLVFGFSIDYLHCLLIGVCKSVTCLWFDKDSPFYVGEDILNRIETRLETITPPTSISRRPRKLSARIHFKANEWRSWLLYYSLPCLVKDLPRVYLKHHCLLVSASIMMLKDQISQEELTNAALFLVLYVAEYQRIYGRPYMGINVHLLLHLGKMVKLYGPLWCYSAFSFESANGFLIKLVKGTTGVVSQIVEKYGMCRLMTQTLDLYTVSNKVSEFCEKMICFRASPRENKIKNTTVLGAERYVLLSVEERQLLVDEGITPSNYSYQSFIKNGAMFHAECYSRMGKKSNDSLVQLANRELYGVIKKILVVLKDGQKCVKVLIQYINVEQSSIITHHAGAKAENIIVCSPIVFAALALIDAEDINCVVVLMRCGADTYVSTLPNIYDKD